MNEREVIEGLVDLVESWMGGIMARIGITWQTSPPALEKARQWLAAAEKADGAES